MMTKRVVIVGGGTAGWMTAAYLKRALPRLPSVTVVESPNIRTIGVGEATFSTLKLFFDFLGLKEEEWMPSCNATYKLAVKFVNWRATPGHFYHPFQRYKIVRGFPSSEWWLKLRRDHAFDASCFTVPALCDAKRSPRYLDGTVFDEDVRPYFDSHAHAPNSVLANHTVQYPYGYHFDASLLAHYLKQYAVKLGVRHVVDDVLAVNTTGTGAIGSLQTRNHDKIEGDLFVDCTGFRSLLLTKTLGEPFINFSESLPNDSAVAIQVPTDVQKNGIPPYTQATALSAGWAWTIPLFNRNGCGYVYCSKYIARDEAEKELRQFLGPAAEGCESNHISIRVGRNRNAWVKNCVGIGLSSGFVEPLESTGIFFIQHGIEELVNHFPRTGTATEGQLLSYNSTIANCIDGVRDFLTVHYCATDRADTPYWKAVKHLTLSPALNERMMIYRDRLPWIRNIYQPFHGFEAYSWSVILLGMNYRPEQHLAALDNLDDTEAERMFEEVRRNAAQLRETLPSHYEYLARQRRLCLAA